MCKAASDDRPVLFFIFGYFYIYYLFLFYLAESGLVVVF